MKKLNITAADCMKVNVMVANVKLYYLHFSILHHKEENHYIEDGNSRITDENKEYSG